ncbi:MAG: glycosyl hydrolase, partial [Bacteroidaceae bacterium]|nr:glycosyl hydrolase [Bacteroidaceae bacterium]
MLEFAAEPIENVRIGFIGLGMRGYDAVYRMTFIDGVEVVALCDLVQAKVDMVQDSLLVAKGLPRAAEYVG